MKISATDWTSDALKEFDSALDNLEANKSAPQTGQASKMIWTARVTRAEKALAIASIKADVAALIQQLMNDTSSGEVSLKIPEIELEITTSW